MLQNEHSAMSSFLYEDELIVYVTKAFLKDETCLSKHRDLSN